MCLGQTRVARCEEEFRGAYSVFPLWWSGASWQNQCDNLLKWQTIWRKDGLPISKRQKFQHCVRTHATPTEPVFCTFNGARGSQDLRPKNWTLWLSQRPSLNYNSPTVKEKQWKKRSTRSARGQYLLPVKENEEESEETIFSTAEVKKDKIH